MKGTVYILQSITNGKYYIGSTLDLERRLEEHFQGRAKYSSWSGPYKLVFKQEYNELLEARRIENRLKKLKSRKIIERIIEDGIIKLDS